MATIIKIIPISLSTAFKPFSPNKRCTTFDIDKISALTSHAAQSAIVHSVIILGFWLDNSINAAIVDGPAIIGTAKGTINGSPPAGRPITPPGGGNIILKAIKNKIIPPAILTVSCLICKKSSNTCPLCKKTNNITSAIHSSRIITIRRLLGSIVFNTDM